MTKGPLVLALTLLTSFAQAQAPAPELPRKSDGFLWGVANASFQVEGSPVASDWTRWTHEKGRIDDGSTADQATRFWTRYDEDFKLAQDLGANAFRISIGWDRIETDAGKYDDKALAAYEKMIVAMRARGLEPVVTLYHFVLPAWLADNGGLLDPDFPDRFAAYTEYVVKRLAAPPANVKLWMTINEPMVLVNAGFMLGEWPPGRKNDAKGSILAAANLARAHLKALSVIRAMNRPELRVGFAAHWRDFQAQGGFLDAIVARITDWVFNRQFVTAATTGRLFFWMPGAPLVREKIPLPGGRPGADFIGVNYYGRSLMELSLKAPFFVVNEGPGLKTDIGWEIYPEGLYRVLKDLQRYNVPLLVTENGLADATDKLRPEFLRAHLVQLAKARAEGVPVFGYLHWSLTDNFEWAKGLTPRFGLVNIDYATGARQKRPSYDVYKSFIH